MGIYTSLALPKIKFPIAFKGKTNNIEVPSTMKFMLEMNEFLLQTKLVR